MCAWFRNGQHQSTYWFIMLQIRSFALSIIWLTVAYSPAPCLSLEQGFVYCPAYPCLCESDNGALVVNCQYLYLTHLPKFLAFDGRIRTLSLRQNSIRQLPARAFMGLHVESLDLTDNVVSHVHDMAFEGLEDSLEELHIQVYAMKGLPSEAIKRLKRLRVLRIIGCKVNTLTSTAFEGLTSLVELHLEGCRVKEILPGSLASLKQLEVLNLEGNNVQFQHLGEVGKLYELRKLVLAKNKLATLGNNAFDHLLHLRFLDLSHNKMTVISDDAFRPLQYSLEVLKLNDNQLTDDALVTLQNLRNIRLLSLGGNNITSLAPGHFFKHVYLSHLDLSDNRIEQLDRQSFKGTEKYLQILKLDNNPLKLIEDGAFVEHSRLQQLFLDNTNLGGALSVRTFKGLDNALQKVSLGNANLTSIDIPALSDLTGLEFVGLQENAITEIPDGVFEKLQNLKKLDLSKNEIDNVRDSAFRGLKNSLESVDLQDNEIETLSRCLFEGFQRLGDLRLGQNPLVCDCRLAWLHNWLQMTLPEYHRSLLQWECAEPDDLTRRYFGSLFMADLKCPNASKTAVPACNSSNVTPLMPKDVPELRRPVPSPLMPLGLRGTELDVTVEARGRSALLVKWNVTSDKKLAGFRVVIRRGNDSFEEADMTFSTEVWRYLFTGLQTEFVYESCVTVVDEDDAPVGRVCTEAKTGNSSLATTQVVVESTVLPISFTTLLWSYISGCLVASTLCAIVAAVVRRRRQIRKCPHAFRPGYTAWSGTRLSIPSSSAATSTCYFAAPSLASYDDDGLVMTIGGVSNDHSVVDRISTTDPAPGDLSGGGPMECIGAITGGVGSGDYSFTTHGRCSTVSSFRRHLPANYIVTNTEVGDDFFFHF